MPERVEPFALPSLTDETSRAVFDNLSDGVYFVDLSRRITFWNAAAERIAGYAREEVIGCACSDGLLRLSRDSWQGPIR
jgi:PAS domain S-box-containing protein